MGVVKKKSSSIGGVLLRTNPRYEDSAASVQRILLHGGIIWDPEDGEKHLDVLLENGVISSLNSTLAGMSLEAIRAELSKGPSIEIIDISGRIVTPGIVDMHSHIGMDSWPGIKALEDTNEFTVPTLPQLRTLDAFNQADPAIAAAASGGVTTVLVLPGSALLMGGEAYAFKLRPPVNGTSDEMLVNYGLPEGTGWRWMKMACEQNALPVTRMGEAWLFRERLSKARDLLRRQDAWCAAAERIQNNENTILSERFPEDLSNESLVALMRGQVNLNVHVMRNNYLEMVIRVMKEFNVPISAFHHALEAYLIPDLIRRTNVTVATFADLWGYKNEAYRASVNSPRILAEHNIPVALKSDHPVINSQFMMYEAAKAHQYGLSSNLALASVTTVPAKALGLGHRIGRLLLGYDADLTVWDAHPFALGARPLQVFIDGLPQLKFKRDLSNTPKPFKSVRHSSSKATKPLRPLSTSDQRNMTYANTPSACSVKSHTFALRNIGKLFASPDHILDADKLEGNDDGKEIAIAVVDGIIQCVGLDCEEAVRTNNGDIYDLHGGVLIPGLVSSGLPLGLNEIEQEPTTGDGDFNDPLVTDPNLIPHAEDGFAFEGKHLRAALASGIISTVSLSSSNNVLIKGLSVAARTAGTSTLDSTSIIKSRVALHVEINSSSTSKTLSTVSAQIAALRNLLISALYAEKKTDLRENHFADVARGIMPLVVHTHSKDNIAAVMKLRDELRWHHKRQNGIGEGLNLVIFGGVEAHLLAADLADYDIPVVLQPARCQQSTWSMRRCLVGQPLTQYTAAQKLHKAGVKVSLSNIDIGAVRELLWETGFQHHRDTDLISEAAAIGMVTWEVANAFGLSSSGRITEGNAADFVALDGNPLQFGSHITLVSSSSLGVVCHPKQD
ncbi:hypothetical protein BDF19DRAFT_411597 [Syncephalis fuscata]|nr:hypothetical protein BDF19DRAFT_411597 [Syncephalis fuscata]